MKNLSIMEVVVLSAALILIPLVTRAALDESKVLEGVVSSIQKNVIAISVPSADKEQSNIVDFQMQETTHFDGLTKDAIKDGDKVKIGYHQENQVYLADSITNVK